LPAEPQVALHFVRKCAEGICKQVYRFEGLEKEAKPARKMQLEELLVKIRVIELPEVAKLLLNSMQMFGNFGSHDQGEQTNDLTTEIARPVLLQMDEVVKWFVPYKKQKTAL
jgi:hypothetical protein